MTSSGTSAAGLKAPLLIASAGAAVILLAFLGTLAEGIGLAAILLGTVLAAPSKDSAQGPEIAGVHWWRLLVAGALVSLVAFPLSLVLGTIGGLLAGFGGALVIVAAAFGYPR